MSNLLESFPTLNENLIEKSGYKVNNIKINYCKNDSNRNLELTPINDKQYYLDDEFGAWTALEDNLNINMEETEIGEDVKFMNGEEVSKYKSNNRSEPQRTKETIQRAYNAPQKVVELNKEQQTKKKSLLRRLKEFFTGNIVKSDDVELIAVIEESTHKKFENEVSQNGRLKGCTDHVIKEKDYEKSNIEREEQTEEKTR